MTKGKKKAIKKRKMIENHKLYIDGEIRLTSPKFAIEDISLPTDLPDDVLRDIVEMLHDYPPDAVEWDWARYLQSSGRSSADINPIAVFVSNLSRRGILATSSSNTAILRP